MIIFDLDGTLADCEHRRHFVDHLKNEFAFKLPNSEDNFISRCIGDTVGYARWKPDYKSFYEACDKDEPIESVVEISRRVVYSNWEMYGYQIEIWSGRCESVREKTESWLNKNEIFYKNLKMRPIGDNTPDDKLKEKWLDESIAEGKTIDFVFDDRPKVIRMWRRRGIFVFNCCQHDGEF